MSRYAAVIPFPVSSEEARERREAETEASDAALELQRLHRTDCRSGWLGEDDDGHPIPCLLCRPHLRKDTQ